MKHTSMFGVAISLAILLVLTACGRDGGGGSGATPPPATSSGGVLLRGDPSMPAVDAMVDTPPVGAARGDIQNGVILTRLDVRLRPGATVGEVNAALAQVGGGIVSMRRGYPAFTVAIPRPQNLDALKQVAQTLGAAPGIAFADIAHTSRPDILPPSPAGDAAARAQMAHLLPTRFPAAWNASRLATQGCADRKVPVLVVDHFASNPPDSQARFPTEVPGFTVASGDPSSDVEHGYVVTTVLGALFDDLNPTGANPYTNCLEIKGINVAGLTPLEEHQRILLNMPDGKFLLNRSLGYPDSCENGCTPANVEENLPKLRVLALDTADWIMQTSSRWDDFLMSVPAGNSRDKEGPAIYPGLGAARFESAASIAALPDLLSLPVPFAFAQDRSLWDATVAHPDFPSLVATNEEMDRFSRYAETLLSGGAGPAPNVLIVGSTTSGASAQTLTESVFSDSAPDIYAVGEGVYTLSDYQGGTSLTAPQVTGLASYLWLLSPDLRGRPASVTRQAIVANVQRSASGLSIIDAYAAALSLDQAAAPTSASAPVRLAILDVVPDGSFNHEDLAEFMAVYVDPNGGYREPANPAYSRWDLNGNGYGGGARAARFDLDRAGSTQYGETLYTTVQQQIEGETVAFNEAAVTDLQVLCYYAYSPLYTGGTTERTQLLGARCWNRARLPATGQTICYDSATHNTLACAGTGQDGELQAGAAWPSPRFTAAGDCVTDNLTGLMWAFNERPIPPLRQWQPALDYAKGLNLCGFDDWRMPNRNELQSLANFGVPDGSPWLSAEIGNVGNPVVPTNIWFWSSTSSFRKPGRAWGLRLGPMIGHAFTNPKDGALSVLPVRSAFLSAPAQLPATGQTSCYDSSFSGAVIACAGTGQDADLRAGVAWPSPRFVVGSGAQAACVTDRLTGLTWMQAPPTALATWLDALTYANNLTLCGFSDWRLPNTNELLSLTNGDQLSPGVWLNTQGFTGVQIDSGNRYWSSTTFTLTDNINLKDPNAWIFTMNDIQPLTDVAGSTSFNDKRGLASVWPMRSAQ